MIEIVQGGMLCTLQDAGRTGLRRVGIPWSGALVPDWLRLANILVGNPDNTAVIECFDGGLVFDVVESSVRIACTGDAQIWLQSAGSVSVTAGETNGRVLRPWCSHKIDAGHRVHLRSTGAYRLAAVAISGLNTPHYLGSAATYSKAGLGGLGNGQPLRAGDTLQHPPAAESAETALAPWPTHPDRKSQAQADTIDLRAVRGPQINAFDDAAFTTFFNSEYLLTRDCDRMGARLEGNTVAHQDPSRRDIVSDAIIPGSVQIPGNGQPIVMLADAHTAGGYPKIATVISIDLAWLGLARPGTAVRFDEVSASEAIKLVREHEALLMQHISSKTVHVEAWLDESALFQENLIDGVTDGNHANQS